MAIRKHEHEHMIRMIHTAHTTKPTATCAYHQPGSPPGPTKGLLGRQIERLCDQSLLFLELGLQKLTVPLNW